MQILTGALDISRVEELRPVLLALLEEPEPALDLSALTACDLAGLQLLLATGLSAAARGKALHCSPLPDCLRRAAAGAGLEASLATLAPQEALD